MVFLKHQLVKECNYPEIVIKTKGKENSKEEHEKCCLPSHPHRGT